MEFLSKEREKKEAISASAHRLKVFNPYYAYGIESGRWFYHEDVVKKIKYAFEKKPLEKMIVIQGNKGSGKSSTLLRMQEDDNIDFFPPPFQHQYIKRLKTIKDYHRLLSISEKTTSDLQQRLQISRDCITTISTGVEDIFRSPIDDHELNRRLKKLGL